MSLTAVILTNDEEDKIARAIDSVSFADEILLVDDGSSDRTVELAKKKGARVLKRSLKGDFAKQRNFALSKVRHDWVLFLDADEEVTKELKDEIVQKINNPLLNFEGYTIKREDIFLGKRLKYGETGNIRLLRLGKTKAGSWSRKVHEIWDVKGEVGRLKKPFVHYPHKSVGDFLQQVNKMSSLHALANEKEGKNSNPAKIIFWPFAKFVQNYILRLGFLDGMRGFIYAATMSLHSFLAWGKQWLIQKNTKKSY